MRSVLGGLLLLALGLLSANRAEAAWSFRGVGTMNVTRDTMGMPLDQYRATIHTAVKWAKEVGANCVEEVVCPNDKPTFAELMRYYRVMPEEAHAAGLHVYYRPIPPPALADRIVRGEGAEYDAACREYFATLEKLWRGVVRPGDILSTFSEGDSRFTDALGWEQGTAKYRRYLRTACDFVDGFRKQQHMKLLHVESVCGGEARLRDQFDAEVGPRLDFIAWDQYAGIGGAEDLAALKKEAADTVAWIRKYSAAFHTRIALGEWSTHWVKPHTKQQQAAFIETMLSSLQSLPPSVFPGMEYFHFALPQATWDYDKRANYYGAPVVDSKGPFPGFYVLQKWYRKMRDER